RHTRFSRDWSSDVCSSDLVDVVDLPRIENIKLTYRYPEWSRLDPRTVDPGGDIRAVAGTEVEIEIRTDRPLDNAGIVANGDRVRSEERRVGKGGRGRGATD